MGDERDEIRARADLVQLVGQRVALKQAGKDWKGLCPFHDDRHPSFVVSPSMGRYKCWACGEGGDVFSWVMKTQNVDFREALEILARETGVTLANRASGPSKTERIRYEQAMEEALRFFRKQYESSAPARDYCERRGLDAAAIQAWEIGYAPDVGDALASALKRNGYALAECKQLFLVDEDPSGGFFDKFRGRLIFPIRDEHGKLVAFGGRLLGDGHPKYINSGDTPLYRKSRVLYGMFRAKDEIAKTREAVLVEGYLDVIACHRAGLVTAVASLGTALAQDQARLLKRWGDAVTILYDADDAGAKASERATDVLQAEELRVRVALLPQGQDPDTLLRDEGPEAVVATTRHAVAPLDHRLAQLRKRLDPSEEAFWPEAFDILSTARTPMELDEQIVALASLWPFTRDPIQAQKSLRDGEQRARRRRRREARGDAPSESAPTRELVEQPKMDSAEREVLRAFLEAPVRVRAWDVLAEEDLFFTRPGGDLAQALRDAFREGPPEGAPSHWLHLVEPEPAREALAEIAMKAIAPASLPVLEDAVARLRDRRNRRAREALKQTGLGDDVLQEILAGLRGDHGSGP